MKKAIQYAKVVWTINDIQTINPKLTDKQAEKFLKNNESSIQDGLVEKGWSVIRDLMIYDGLK